MAWWRKASPPEQTVQEQLPSNREDDEALVQAHAEADRAIEKVRRQSEEKRSLLRILEDIRKQNHFAEIWKDEVEA